MAPLRNLSRRKGLFYKVTEYEADREIDFARKSTTVDDLIFEKNRLVDSLELDSFKQRKELPKAKEESVKKRLSEVEDELTKMQNSMMLQRGILEAGMLRLSRKKQEAKIKEAVDNFYKNTIGYRKAKGLSTAGLEKRWKTDSNKVVNIIMNMPANVRSKNVQKRTLAIGAVARGGVVAGVAATEPFIDKLLPNAMEGWATVGAVLLALTWSPYRYDTIRHKIRDLDSRYKGNLDKTKHALEHIKKIKKAL